VPDSNGIKQTLTKSFCKLIKSWPSPSPDFLIEKLSLAPGEQDDGIHRWNIGLTLSTEDVVGNAIEELLQFAADLASQTGCAFVFGAYDSKKDLYEDVYSIDLSGPIKLDSLFEIENR
jgi:hypothetical protein